MRSYCRVLSALAVLLIPVLLAAQSFTGTIRGTVKDQSGAILPGVQISITQMGTNQVRTAVTNESGDYNVPFLTVGQYRVQAEFSGFKTEVRENITLNVDQVVRADFALQVGEISERLVVTESAPLLSTDRADVGNIVDEKKLVELPLNGRGFETLALIQPGTLAPAQGSALAFRGGFNVAGSREVSNNFIVDGVDNNNIITGEVVYRPNPDVIQEFKVQTNAYSAEFGRGTGGQINVTTKGGTNEFHGSVYEFFRNDALDARNFFSASKPKLRHNQFGANVGGPIIKDRTFFLFSYEGLRRSEGIVNRSTVPTVRMRAGDLGESSGQVIDPLTGNPFSNNIIPQDRINPVARQILQGGFWPEPTSPGTSTNLTAAPNAVTRDNSFTGRVDHRFTDRDNIMFRLSHSHPPSDWPYGGLGARQGVPGFGRFDSQSKTSSTLNYIRILSPSIVNELRLGYNLLHSDRRQIDDTDYAAQFGLTQNLPPGVNRILPKDAGLPSIQIAGLDTIGTYRPQERKDHTYQIQDTVSWTTGRHAAKIGVDLRKIQSNSFTTGSTAGQFNFDANTFARNAFANFLLGYPSRTTISGGDNDGRIRKTEAYHFFFQDDWRVNNRLTFNLGVRYELNMPGYDELGRAGSYDPVLGRVITGQEAGIPKGIIETDKNNWGPRVGFAVRPFNDDKTVLRGGYGVFYHTMILGNETSIILFGAPFRPTYQFTAPAGAPVLTFQNPFPASLANDSSTPGSIDRNMRSSYVQNYSLSLQRQLAQDVVLELTYSGNLGRKLLGQFALNQARPGPLTTLNQRRPIAGYGNINQRFAGLNSSFNSLQSRFEKRFSDGFSLLGSWTYSHTIDQGSEHDAQAQDTLNWAAERASADFDVRHRVVISYIYDLPFGRERRFLAGASSVVDAILGGWQVSGISTFQSGQPFTVRSGGSGANSTDFSGTGALRDRPNLVGDPKLDDPTPERWFNTDAFVVNPSGFFGTAGRNILTADGLSNTDFSVMKNFFFNERTRLQFRTEFFNLLNQVNFNRPNFNAGTTSFGRVTDARDGRAIQFALKLYY